MIRIQVLVNDTFHGPAFSKEKISPGDQMQYDYYFLGEYHIVQQDEAGNLFINIKDESLLNKEEDFSGKCCLMTDLTKDT